MIVSAMVRIDRSPTILRRDRSPAEGENALALMSANVDQPSAEILRRTSASPADRRLNS
jgi:hypothetical protein